MARIAIEAVFVALLMWLLAEKGLCRPESKEESYDYYPNDDEGEYDDEKDDTYSGLPPVMKSKPLTLEVHPGEAVALPCATLNMTHDLDVFTVIWKKGSTLLFVDKIQQGAKDPRIAYRRHNNSLVVTNIKPSDSGHYSCIYSSTPEVELKHIVNVYAPASIKSIQPSGSLSIEKGSAVTLKCNVTGYPHPDIVWKKLGKHGQPDATVIATSENITFNSVERLDSGTYECIAKNNQGPDVSAQVSIHVVYAPEIDIDEELVTSGKDYEAVLKCVVHAEPKAKVHWLKDNESITDDSGRVKTFREGNKYYYHIEKTQVSDFGRYKCIANNSKGTTNSKEIELTGRPLTPRLIRANVGADGRSLDVEWHIISYSPILEYKVQYKNTKEPGKWQVIATPVQDGEEGNAYKLHYQLKDLPAGDFIVTLRARNFYGWTIQAKPHSFAIKNESHEATAETSKMEEGRIHSDSTVPRITAVLTVISLGTFLL